MITPERFWKRVDKSEDCWEWKAFRNKNGYGKFRVGGRGGKMMLAHRYAWELVKGPIPDGLHVLHRCDNPGCVNPDHLFLGTHADNMADMVKKGRQAAGERGGNSKLTESQVTDIRALYNAGGITQTELGQRFGINQSTVSYLIHRKRWGGLGHAPNK